MKLLITTFYNSKQSIKCHNRGTIKRPCHILETNHPGSESVMCPMYQRPLMLACNSLQQPECLPTGIINRFEMQQKGPATATTHKVIYKPVDICFQQIFLAVTKLVLSISDCEGEQGFIEMTEVFYPLIIMRLPGQQQGSSRQVSGKLNTNCYLGIRG